MDQPNAEKTKILNDMLRHARMNECCERFGADSVQHQQAPSSCHSWCQVDDKTFDDVPASYNATSRTEAFFRCLLRGSNGEAESVQGPQALSCRLTQLGQAIDSTNGQQDSSNTAGESREQSSAATRSPNGRLLWWMTTALLVIYRSTI